MGPTLPTAEYFFRGAWGWLASTWIKLALTWGYSDELFESFDDTATGASWGMYTTAVPAGEVHVVQAITLRNETDAPGRTEFLVYNSINEYFHLEWVASLLRYEPLKWVGTITLAEGWRVRVLMDGTDADDVIAGGCAGYKMLIG